MGYTTEFQGAFDISPELQPKHTRYLEKFAQVRHMTWDEELVANVSDPARTAVGLPIGDGGMYFTAFDNNSWAGESPALRNHNHPPKGVPGLWCQWVPDEDGESKLVWDEGEKFYNYVEWLQFLITHFLAPWGYTLNGKVVFRGEDFNDMGAIVVNDNEVTVSKIEL